MKGYSLMYNKDVPVSKLHVQNQFKKLNYSHFTPNTIKIRRMAQRRSSCGNPSFSKSDAAERMQKVGSRKASVPQQSSVMEQMSSRQKSPSIQLPQRHPNLTQRRAQIKSQGENGRNRSIGGNGPINIYDKLQSGLLNLGGNKPGTAGNHTARRGRGGQLFTQYQNEL